MTVEVNGHAVYATGSVVDDLVKFQEAVAQPGIDTVVLVNSPGGDLWTGMRVGRLIADKGLKTVIAGFCVSSCSIMFMGGKERSFSNAISSALTYIGIHGAHDKDTKAVNPQLQSQIFAFYKHNMGDRFNSEVMNKALYDMDDAGALLRVFDAQRLPKRAPYHCKSAASLRKDCTEFVGFDALSLGIVTTNTLNTLELPSAFKQVPTLLGRPLTQILTDPGAYLQTLSALQCSTDTCRKLATDFSSAKDNKALATPIGTPGLGTAINKDTPQQAFFAAISACNHIKDKPARLCEAQTINGYDVRDFYTAGLTSHAQAREQLVAPSGKFYANEEYGGGMTHANGLRTKNIIDITPQKLDGIKTWGTQDLARALKSAQAPVLVDVAWGLSDAIPGAVSLVYGGIMFEDATTDAAHESRMKGLLKLLSPDLSQPIVFYCNSRNSWLSVNAALRAQKLGYTNVNWYRGGMESWKAANLPVAIVVVKAVS